MHERLDKKKLIDIKMNDKKTVTNYYFTIYKCEGFLEIKKECEESEHRNCECVKCNTYYPLQFKYKNDLDTEEIIDLFEIKKKTYYMILESLEYYDSNKNKAKIRKAIHVIDLTNEGEINIGRNPNNDIILDDIFVCPEHAVIIYKDGEFLLKNKSPMSGTLVLIKDESIVSKKEKEIYLQADKTFIEVKMMEEKEFLNTKKKMKLNTHL